MKGLSIVQPSQHVNALTVDLTRVLIDDDGRIEKEVSVWLGLGSTTHYHTEAGIRTDER